MAYRSANPTKKKKSLVVKVKRGSATAKKQSIRKKFRGDHGEILKHSLRLLIEDLLPLAVESYSKSPKQGAAYAVTNIISEIRGTIQQLEAAVDTDKILMAISREIAMSLRMSITRMAGHITLLKEGLPLKVKDSGLRRDMTLLIEDILKEYEANMAEVITDVELRISKAVNEVVNGPSTYKRPKKRKKRK